MERFWIFFLHKRQFSYLLVIAALIFGALAIIAIPKESAPEIRIPVGIVTVPFPGGSAVDVERLITNPLEGRLAGGLDYVKKITSVSSEGVSSVVVEFTAEADLDKSIQAIRDEADKVSPEFPEEAKDAIVSDVNFVDQPILMLAIGANLPLEDLQRIGKALEDELTAVAGVSRVHVGGKQETTVYVIAKEEALNTFDISLGQIESAIRAHNTALPAGAIEIANISYSVQFEGSLIDPNDVRSIAITSRNGSPVYIGDVADVVVGLSKPMAFSRVSINGESSKSALTFDIFKRSGGNVATVSQSVREKVQELESTGEILAGLDVLVVFDSGELLKEDLSNLIQTGAQTIILVMIVLFLSIGWRESLIAGIAIPFSFLIGFIALEASGNTINFISLFALILAVGILVDSAIVIVEGIHTNMKAFMDKQEAAERAIRDYHWPVTAGTLTTVAVFAPLFLVSGIVGKFIASIPFTIIFVLIASLFVALGIVPLCASLLLRRRTTSSLEEWQEQYTAKFQAWYREKLLNILGNRRKERLFFIVISVLFVISILFPITGLVKVAFFPQDDVDFITISIEEKEGTVLAKTDIAVREVEEVLYQNTDIDSFVTTVGQTSAFSSDGASSGNKFANIFINLPKDRAKTSTMIVDELRTMLSPLKTAHVEVSEPNNGPPVGAPIVIKLKGDNLEELDATALKIKQLLEEIEGTANVSAGTQNHGLEFALTLDRGKASSYGISPLTVAQTLRTAVQGITATTIKENGEDIDVILTVNLNPSYELPDETNKATIDDLKRIKIKTTQGDVLLGSILNSTLEQSRPSITHDNRERTVSVVSQLTKNGNTNEILAAFSKQQKTIHIPGSVTLQVGGKNEDAQQAFKDMFTALILGIILMLAVLVLQFNSYRYGLYVLSVLPLSLIGVFFGLLITGKALSFTSMMGFIALAGIIVNNSIILIDVINRLRFISPGKTVTEVIVEGSISRLRPIFLTTTTTVIGLIPLSFVSELWSPLAIAIMFGLLFSTCITLFLIPIIYNRWPGKLPGFEQS